MCIYIDGEGTGWGDLLCCWIPILRNVFKRCIFLRLNSKKTKS